MSGGAPGTGGGRPARPLRGPPAPLRPKLRLLPDGSPAAGRSVPGRRSGGALGSPTPSNNINNNNRLNHLALISSFSAINDFDFPAEPCACGAGEEEKEDEEEEEEEERDQGCGVRLPGRGRQRPKLWLCCRRLRPRGFFRCAQKCAGNFPTRTRTPLPRAGAAGGTTPGGILPLRRRSFLREMRSHPRVGSPELLPTPAAADAHVGPANKKKGGCRRPLPAAVPPGSPAAWPVLGTSVPRVAPVTRRDGRHGQGLGCPSAAGPDRRAWPWPW